jgi:hypothetical protein
VEWIHLVQAVVQSWDVLKAAVIFQRSKLFPRGSVISLSRRIQLPLAVNVITFPLVSYGCFLNGATVLFLGFERICSSLILYTVGKTPWTGFAPSQGRYLHTR